MGYIQMVLGSMIIGVLSRLACLFSMPERVSPFGCGDAVPLSSSSSYGRVDDASVSSSSSVSAASSSSSVSTGVLGELMAFSLSCPLPSCSLRILTPVADPGVVVFFFVSFTD